MSLSTKKELLRKIQQLEDENQLLSAFYQNEITERYKIEQSLNDNFEFNASILKTIPFGIGVIDEKGEILFQNESLKQQLGKHRTEKFCWEKPIEEDLVCKGCPLLSGLPVGKVYTCTKELHINKSIFEITLVGLIYRGQKAILQIYRNLSIQKQAEEKSVKLSLAVENSPTSIVITDKLGKIEYVNPKFTQVTGYTLEEVLGKNPRLLKSGLQSPEFYKNLWQTILKGQEWRGEFQNKRKNGDLYWELASISPIKNNDNIITHFVGIKEDITDIKLTESMIEQKNQELIELNATKDKFFSIIAHDLRNPFNAIIGYTELLMVKIENFEPEKAKHITENIGNTAKQTYKLLENLLEWSRLQRGLLMPEFQEIPLKQLAIDCILQVSEMALIKNIGIINQIESDIRVYGDEQMTKTIVRNLLSNGIKFSLPNTYISLISKRIQTMVEIQIKDQGIGIESKKLPLIFSIDKNISTNGTANEKGSGLGLLLCKELVEKQGGKIWAESEPNNGSTFCFTLKNYIEPIREVYML